VAYLVSSNQAIFIVPDSFRVVRVRRAARRRLSFTNSTVKGTYAGSTTTPATLGVGIFSGRIHGGTVPVRRATSLALRYWRAERREYGSCGQCHLQCRLNTNKWKRNHCGKCRRKRYHVHSLPIEVRSSFAERSKSRSLNLRTVAFTSNALCCELQRVAALWSQAFSRLECSLRTALSEDGRTEKTQCCTIPRQTAYSTRLTIS